MDLKQLLMREGKYLDFVTGEVIRASPLFLNILVLDGLKDETPEEIHKLACRSAPTVTYEGINAYVLNRCPDRTDSGGKRYWPLVRVALRGRGAAFLNAYKKKKSTQRTFGDILNTLDIRDAYVEIIPVLYCHIDDNK